MYAAVWWAQAKTWSIIDVKTIVSGDVRTGNFVYALHNGTPYEVKILRMAESFDELKGVNVNTDGTVDHGKALLPSTPITVKNQKTKPSSKAVTKKSNHQKKSGCASNLSPVYTIARSPQSAQPTEVITATLTQTTESMPAARSPQSAQASKTNPSTPTPRMESMPTASPETIQYLKSLVAWLEKGSNDTCLSPPNVVAATSSQPKSSRVPIVARAMSFGEDDLPFPRTRLADPTLLYVGHDVEISKAVRSGLLRKYLENPEEMTRQLIIHLIGDDNLKLLRPRHHGKSEFSPIPPRIMAAIDDFVLNNTKISSFTKSKLTKVVSNYINRLRDPDRGHKKQHDSRMEYSDRSSSGMSSAGTLRSPSKVTNLTRNSPSKTYSGLSSSSSSGAITTQRNSPWKVTNAEPLIPQQSSRPVNRHLFGAEDSSAPFSTLPHDQPYEPFSAVYSPPISYNDYYQQM